MLTQNFVSREVCANEEMRLRGSYNGMNPTNKVTKRFCGE